MPEIPDPILDVVYLYGPEGRHDTEALRYSLRSLRNLPHRRVYVVGWAPGWLSDRVRVIPVPTVPRHGGPGRGDPEHANRQTTANLLVATAALGTRNFILMNDDFFVTSPVVGVQHMHLGPLAEHARSKRPDSPSGVALGRALSALQGLGVRHPLSYEAHVPMIVNAPLMHSILAQYGDIAPIAKRTLYGNLAHCGGKMITDVKSYLGAAYVHRPFTSTDPFTWQGAVGHSIRSLFLVGSPYERESVLA